MLYQLPLAPKYGELSNERLCAGIADFKRRLGSRLVILGHHYQQDDVIQFADFTGDSLKLSQLAAEHHEAEFIVFCGVHFMAETADILTHEKQTVILPDLSAGCSMADMAHIDQVEAGWPLLEERAEGPITPITYVNSSAAVKAFVGRHDGACCTSSNAKMVMERAAAGFLEEEPALKVVGLRYFNVFGPGEAHKGTVYDPRFPDGGLSAAQVRAAQVFLWKGHCSVHQLFTTRNVEAIRALPEPYAILVHPECEWAVCQGADRVGSTEYIIKTVREAPPGSFWAIGTEVNLVQRLARQHPDKHVRSLAGIQCLCTTMYRIDLKHLYWTLENLVGGRVVNRISVDPETRRWSRVALDRMLALRPAQPVSAR
ncbi:MAG: quinolinate synthase NadA [Planctomycetes bacterium]|nr:quinolinate synthase NadA [Planctomycetota bacterium]